MDSRKFMGIINNSAQAKVRFFDEKIQEMGKGLQKEWRLVSLGSKGLIFEDLSTNQYYQARHSGTGSRVTIHDIVAVNIVEDKKKGIFYESCCKLIDAIADNNTKGMQSAYDAMKSARFTGSTIPSDGYVKSKDGMVRKINITESTLSSSVKDLIVKHVIDEHKDRVVVENGMITEGRFNDGTSISLPVNKWASKKLKARKLAEHAKSAYSSPGFQNRVLQVANLVAENKIEDAMHSIAPFLKENEEFTLLSRNQTQTLVENSLATNAIFNQRLCDDVSTLIYKTNLKVNKNTILKEWKNIAKASEHPALVENIMILSESKNFEATYDKFLSMIFEAISNKEVAAEALATTLSVLRDKTPKIKESHDLSSKLVNLIERLKSPNCDDATIYEAEDLVATIQEELTATDTLNDFDQIPGDDMDMEDDSLDVDNESSKTPIININSPLIQIGGTSGKSEPEADIGDGLDLDDMDLESDEELDGLGDLENEDPLASPPSAPGTPATPAAAPQQPAAQGSMPPRMESRNRRGKALNESRPVHYEMKDESDDDMPCETADDMLEDMDDDDPYAIEESVKASTNVHSYGMPIFNDRSKIDSVLQLMDGLRIEHKLSGKALTDNLSSMAAACIESCGFRIPQSKMPSAVREIVKIYSEEWQKPWESGKDNECDPECDMGEESDEEVVDETIESPEVQNISQPEGSVANKLSEGGLRWLQKQSDALLGEYKGVRFIFDHGGPGSQVEPILMSESDQSVEIPIPNHIKQSAFAAAGIGRGNKGQFIKWLDESIEQLRPLSDVENDALNEAILTITTTPDGGINLDMSQDVSVDNAESDELVDMGTGDLDDSEMDSELEMGDDSESDEAGSDLDSEVGDSDLDSELDNSEVDSELDGADAGLDDMDSGSELLNGETDSDDSDNPFTGDDSGSDMSPVDSIKPPSEGGEDSEDEDDGDMPDFDNIEEDMDITDPKNRKYTKEVNGDKRDVTDPKLPKFTGDTLEGIGPELKKDDGTGTSSPTSKKS